MAIVDWTGISQPFRIENGSVATSKSVLNSKDGTSPHISESIRTIVKTQMGEWLTKTNIGSTLRKVTFSLFSDYFDVYIIYTLTNAIEEQDKRVKVSNISIERYETDGLIKVIVKWDINPDIVSNYTNNNGENTTEIEITNSSDVDDVEGIIL